MHTQRTIGFIVAVIALAVVAVVVDLVRELGAVTGLLLSALGVVVLVGGYRLFVGPRLRRWGATDAEVAGALPGDDLRPGAGSTTRAISIAAPPAAVWPWLVQLGWSRGGWYSYDWIDNDGVSSARRIDPALQDLAVGDRILLAPDLGVTVREIAVDRHLVADDPVVGTWCLALRPTDDGCRLVSRWRVDPPAPGPAAWLWAALSDPGSWLMEQRMLRTIRRRVELEVAEQRHPSRAGHGAG